MIQIQINQFFGIFSQSQGETQDPGDQKWEGRSVENNKGYLILNKQDCSLDLTNLL